MVEKREIIQCSVFGGRAVFINRLWDPERNDLKTGKPLDKPRYSVSIILPKTRAKWSEEPALESVTAAALKIYNAEFAPRQIPGHMLIWPVKDGDAPNAKGVIPEYSRGHWVIRADTTNPDYTTIEAVQNGKATELPAAKLGGRTVVKDGDFCILTIGLAKSAGTSPGIKTYLNGIVFTASGEPVKIGSRTDSATLLQQALAQGLNVSGVGAGSATAVAGSDRDDGIPF